MLVDNWQNCAPRNLCDLFYRVLPGGLKRIENAFVMPKSGIDKILELGSKLKTIRVYMGYDPEANPGFAPFIYLKTGNYDEHYYFRLNYDPETSFDTSAVGVKGVFPDLLTLFKLKWKELSNTEIFFAVEAPLSIHGHDNESGKAKGEFRRVKYFDFGKEETQGIALRIKEAATPFLHIYPGAGFSVNAIRPFSFSPILDTNLLINEKDPYANINGTASFDRSQPCPPYCSNGYL